MKNNNIELYPEDNLRRRSKAYHEKRRRLRRIKRLGLAAIPFVFFLIGLILISIGFVRFIEQESALAIFLVSRDSVRPDSFEAVSWTALPTDAPLPPVETHVIKPTESGSTERLKVPFYYIGQQFGTLYIPSVDIELPVMQGDRERDFKRGAGHFPGSYFPGQGGNILLGAHRTNHFRNFEYLTVGDEVTVETTYGRFVYRIDELRITDDQDPDILAETGEERLTMYTCYPFIYVGNAPQRFVVFCSLLESEVNT